MPDDSRADASLARFAGNRSMKTPIRRQPFALLLLALLGVGLAYLVVASWLLDRGLARLGLRAQHAFSAYLGDVRARRVVLDDPDVALSASSVRGHLDLRSLLDRQLVLDGARATLQELRVGSMTWRGTGTIALQPVDLLADPSPLRGSAHLPSGALSRSPSGPREGTLAGDVEFDFVLQDRIATSPRAAHVAAKLRADIDDLGQLLGHGPALRIDATTIQLDLRGAVGSNGRWDPSSVAFTTTISGKGADAGKLFDLLDRAPALRWMFAELVGAPYTFELELSSKAKVLHVRHLLVEAGIVRGEGQLTFEGGRAQGDVLVSRGDFHIGVRLNGDEVSIDAAAPADWLQRPLSAQPR